MEWQQVIGSLVGSSPLAGGLAFVAWTLWKDNQAIRAENTRLQAEFNAFLRTLLPKDDD